jgi:uncharacterized membrane protein
LGKKKKRRKALKEKTSVKEEALVQEEPAQKKKKKRRQPVPTKREHPNWPLTALAGAGMALTGYLVLTFYLGTPPLYCEEGSTCDIVQQSRWGTFLGIPTALFGFMAYAALAFIGFRVRSPGLHWKSAWIVSLVGLGYSIYLNAISLFVIEAACLYCLTSLSIMAAIFGVVFVQRPAGLPNFKYATWAGETIVLAMVIVGGMHLYYSGVFDPSVGPEDPYLKGLAQHLTEEGAVFYGAFW